MWKIAGGIILAVIILTALPMIPWIASEFVGGMKDAVNDGRVAAREIVQITIRRWWIIVLAVALISYLASLPSFQ